MLEYKYLISIDGWASDQFRASMILRSNSVPVVIESNFTPLHLTSWEPWKHYVPVKNDLSDLVENLMWLHNNDKKAKQIAENGIKLYEMLYTYDNMVEDSASVFKKYASLMKYEVQRPNEVYRWENTLAKDRSVKDEF